MSGLLSMARLLWIACVLAALCACSSAPLRYHSLIDDDDRGCRAASMPGRVSPPPLLIEVAPVHVARILNTAEMISVQPDGSLQVREGDYWSSPLPDELRSAISFGLQERLCALDTYYLESAPGKIRYRIRADLQKADFNAGTEFYGAVLWVVQRNDDVAMVSGKTTVKATVPASVDGQLIAYKRLARSVAADIAVAIHSLENQP